MGWKLVIAIIGKSSSLVAQPSKASLHLLCRFQFHKCFEIPFAILCVQWKALSDRVAGTMAYAAPRHDSPDTGGTNFHSLHYCSFYLVRLRSSSEFKKCREMEN